MLLPPKEKSASNEDLKQLADVKKTEKEERKEDTQRSFYAHKINRSQLSQEEIEEMVKSIYSVAPKENMSENINTNNSNGLQNQLIGNRVEYEDKVNELFVIAYSPNSIEYVFVE